MEPADPASVSAAARAKLEALEQSLAETDGVLVAFSGGVDSSLLLAVALRAAKGPVLAVTMASPVEPSGEAERARALARRLGARHRVVEIAALDDPVFAANPPDRCYHCKRRILGTLSDLARTEGLAVVVEGSNSDDEGDYRPGRRAVAELGVRSPLSEVGLTKDEIRELAHMLDLPNWDRPALACLASRVPYGEELTTQRLRRIDRAEEHLRSLGFLQVRVRDHGETARIEVPPELLPRLTAEPVRSQVVSGLKEAGYLYVAVDLEGYRSGAMNEVLGAEALEAEAPAGQPGNGARES